MEFHWDELAEKQPGTGLDELLRAARVLAKEAGLGVFGGASLSLKRSERNVLGQEEEILYVDHGSLALEKAVPGCFSALRSQPLAGLTILADLDPAGLWNELAGGRVRRGAPGESDRPVPPGDALLHAVLPFRAVLFSRPDAIMALGCGPDGLERLRKLYGEAVIILPYAAAGLALAKACSAAISTGYPTGRDGLAGIWIDHQGLVTFGDTPREACQSLFELTTRAETRLGQLGAGLAEPPAVPQTDRSLRVEVAALRRAISSAAGAPVILALAAAPEQVDWEHPEDGQHGPWSARDAALIGAHPLEVYNGKTQPPAGSTGAGRAVLERTLGLVGAGRTSAEALLSAERARRTLRISACSRQLGGQHPRTDPFPGLMAGTLQGPPPEGIFTGEVALVTGGASGIGKACVESLLARGAAVVSLDLSPKVLNQFDSPAYRGIQCDLVEESAVMAAFEQAARAFGGLDMLVLNAGVFPAGIRIEALSLTEWQRVMHINLDSNLVVLREAHPLLKQSPRGGRVLVNASKNVLAPGIGAAAYSSSKAAVTQLARVAALEWGKDGIRVNMVHPDAVFDTGIWTEDVLKARAAHYGMTVQQYKTRNVLGVEMDSHYVGELIAEMLGPLFERITGAQIPVDGGSDRVI